MFSSTESALRRALTRWRHLALATDQNPLNVTNRATPAKQASMAYSISNGNGHMMPGKHPLQSDINSLKKFQSNGTSDSSEPILEKVLRKVQEHQLVCGQTPKAEKVVDFIPPAELEEILKLELGPEPATEKELEDTIENTINYSIKTNHPMFFNQLYKSTDEYGLAGSWLSDVLNTNCHTFEVAPVFIVVEKAVLRWIMSKFGWAPNTGDGIFSPGGSMSNMYGMALARHHMFPETKREGLNGKQFIMFTSEESHYSIRKGAVWMGMGWENVRVVATDERGRMLPQDLEKQIIEAKNRGQIPYFVNATCGSTVMGSYDPLDEIADVCEKHGLWFHVDACWGGSAILSKKHKYLLKGCERADSIAWNPHKMLGAPLQTSPFIVRHPGLLHQCNSAAATYLFQQDKFYDVTYDAGDKSIQCGRKVDAFKFYFMLKARGERALERSIDNCFEKALYLHQLVEKTPGFEPAFSAITASTENPDLNCTNVCFHYVPKRLRGLERNEEWHAELSKIPPKIKEYVIRKGSIMVGYQPCPHKRVENFFRMVVPALPQPTYEDMERVIQEIAEAGETVQ